MKKVIFLCLATTSFALMAGIVSCLSSQATALPQPSVTHTVIELLTSTPSITATPTWTGNYDDDIATVAAAQTHAAKFPRLCDEYYPNEYSPDGLWLVEICFSKEDDSLILTLSNRETQVLWKLLYKEYIPDLGFIPDGGLIVVHWSNDGRYAYFTSFLGGDGGECFYDGWDSGEGLFRVDLQTGQTKAILPLNDDLRWYGFSISPNDRLLVYGIRSLDLQILDLTTGLSIINIQHKKNFSQSGGYVWSPDGAKFVYSTVTYSSNNAGIENYSIRLVDSVSGNERVILEASDECFDTVSWTKNDTLTIEKNYGQSLIEFDLNSNTVISATTTTP